MYIQDYLNGCAYGKKTKIDAYKVEYDENSMCDVVRVIDPEINENGFTFFLYLIDGWSAVVTNNNGEVIRILDENLEDLGYE